MNIGIQAASIYVPNIYLSINELAIARNIDSDKLTKGLGLHKMVILDVHEDTATIAANALLKLIKDFDINPNKVGRIYLGTESALDAAKPTVTYAVQLVESVLEKEYGRRSFKHADMVDMTFACIGGVDALQNSLDFIRLNPEQQAIVIAADYAKYGLESTGEYTQGAGAVALLISAQPDLIAIDRHFGVATESVFDFFKPRQASEEKVLLDVLKTTKQQVEIFSDEPVFEGQYSNECYKNRLREAYFQFKDKKEITGNLYQQWRFLAFHLPYAFQGKRMFTEIFAIENDVEATNENQKTLAKSDEYLDLVAKKIEPTQRASSEIGNMYTASVFTAFLSALQVAFDEGEELQGEKIGFLSYGSGSKSKVFEGIIGTNWKKVIEKIDLFNHLNQRQPIDFKTYESIHNKSQKKSVGTIKGFAIDRIETQIPHLIGARYYKFVP